MGKNYINTKSEFRLIFPFPLSILWTIHNRRTFPQENIENIARDYPPSNVLLAYSAINHSIIIPNQSLKQILIINHHITHFPTTRNSDFKLLIFNTF